MSSASRFSTVCRSDFSNAASARQSTIYRRRVKRLVIAVDQWPRGVGVIRGRFANRAKSLSTCNAHPQWRLNHSRSHAA